jgi:hypothetical protein
MHELITLIAIVLLVLLFNQIYFSIYKEKVVFFKYFKGITIYSTTIIIFFIFLLNFNFIGKIDNNFLQSSIITYIFIFLVMFFNISTKSYESPTVIIYNIIKKEGASYNKILKLLKKKKLVKIRFKDLFNQKLIKKTSNKIILTPLGYKFSSFYLFLKSFFKIKCKG